MKHIIQLLLDELTELRIVSDKKVDHPRKKSKDLADAVCGAIYNSVSLGKRDSNQMIEVHDIATMKKRWREQEREDYDPLFDKPDPKDKDVFQVYLDNIGMM